MEAGLLPEPEALRQAAYATRQGPSLCGEREGGGKSFTHLLLIATLFASLHSTWAWLLASRVQKVCGNRIRSVWHFGWSIFCHLFPVATDATLLGA
jgi:hypothetical protein